jgi:hypothetical protein
LTETDPQLLDDLNALVEPDARGDPMSSLRWTCKSLRRLAAELNKLACAVPEDFRCVGRSQNRGCR